MSCNMNGQKECEKDINCNRITSPSKLEISLLVEIPPELITVSGKFIFLNLHFFLKHFKKNSRSDEILYVELNLVSL